MRFAYDSLSKLLTLRLVGLVPSSGRAVVVRSEPKPPLGPLHSCSGILKPEINDAELELAKCLHLVVCLRLRGAIPILSHTAYCDILNSVQQ